MWVWVGGCGVGGGWRMTISVQRVKRLPSTYDYIHAQLYSALVLGNGPNLTLE